MTKRKILNHYRGRRYAKKRYPRTFAAAQGLTGPPDVNAERFIEAIGMAYVAGIAAGVHEVESRMYSPPAPPVC